MYVPKGVAEQEQLAAAIAKVEQMLGEDVVRLRYTIGTSWSGEPAIYFRVLLSDEASRRDRLHKVATHVRAVIQEHLDPLNSWDLFPYFSFRSQTEQDTMKEPAWA